mmetsp:Transcript_6508/g.10309  ORF Transcript_6508/g.10309 Transcript_6508/m.10309 type:complete len:180 (+) Transcript_6508:96-635(+)|eukprot:CAMPEP_0184313844 /NCGR_PEP_ID=MMETSP1049-20130417/68344_1 /TAXON_ID=77928 /ORGANISM="Proteomonas sulcata, Strain CCMP704" /LENGTH=179 /DNA_ID=CAMNT_0026631399 /DNA_START=45 /DNA_END=584 /DNA_ORIENTATION=+
MLRQAFSRVVVPIAGRAIRAQAAPGATSFFKARSMSSNPLEGSKTLQNLKDAFAGEAMAHQRYLYYAQRADVEGFPDLAVLFRALAEGESQQAMGHLEFLQDMGDPVTNQPMGNSYENVKSAIVGETHDSTDMYPQMAKEAAAEGFEDVAEWFETLAVAEKTHLKKLQKAHTQLEEDLQ